MLRVVKFSYQLPTFLVYPLAWSCELEMMVQLTVWTWNSPEKKEIWIGKGG